MRLYKYIQKDIQQENLQYQDLVEYSVSSDVYPAKKSIIRNYLSAMDFYTPTDTDYACRYRILTKIINKYYNYELFTDNYEYFGNRMLWRLNKIMPTYRAKFNSLLAQNGYEDIWEDGLLWEHREGTRDTKRPEKDTDNHPVNFDRTDLADTTTTVGYNSDYPQVIVGSSTDYNATGDKTTTGRTGNDTVTHAMQENVGYGEDITRKFSPEEIAKAKLLFAQLIFNIDEEIVNAVADLFVLVDYPFEDDFDVAIQMSILDDAKAYTNLKFNEGKAYTDQEVAKAKEIVYIPYDSSTPHSEIYDAIVDAVTNGKLPILKDTYNDKLWYLMDFTSGVYEFANGIDWVKYDYLTTTTGFYIRPELFKCIYNQTTFAEITQALSDGKLPYCVFTTGEYFYYYLAIGNTKYRFTESYIRESGVTYFIDVDNTNQWGIVPRTVEMQSNKTTSISSASTDAQYPSAKCVYNALQNVDKVYVCTYGTTTYDDIYDVWTNSPHKVIVCQYNGDFYVCNHRDNATPDRFRFVSITGQYDACKVRFLFCANQGGGWSTDDIDLQEELVSGTNIKTINSTTLLGGGNIDTRELYECTFSALGTGTTFAQVGQALTNGKIPYVTYDDGTHYDSVYFYAYSESGVYTFTVAFTDAIGIIYCYSDDTWAQSSIAIGGGGSSLVTETVTLLANAWITSGSGYEQSVSTINDSNHYDTIWVSPKTDGVIDYMSDYTSNGVYCKQGGYLYLTFYASSVPSQDIVVNVTMG